MRKLLTVSVAALFTLALGGCDQQPTPPDSSPSASGTPGETPRAPVVDVAAVHEHGAANEHRFEIERTALPSGWTTFRFANEAHVPHFLVVQKLPDMEATDGMTLEEYVAGVTEPFQTFMDLINDPEVSFGTALGTFAAQVDSWYLDPGVTIVGGPGLTDPGRTSRSTLDLEPGRYVVECYVKTGGVFHSVNGMIDMLTVTEAENGARAPRADVELTVSSGEGIEVDDAGPPGKGGFRPGEQTVAVHFGDQSVYSHFLGHDVHLARLGADADRDELGAWMNWSATGALETPAPAGIEWMGGTQDAPAGATTYLTVNLRPGNYAWVAEVPDPDARDMLMTFSVP